MTGLVFSLQLVQRGQAQIAQEPVRVLADDDWDSLEARIHEAEHRIYPEAVRALVEGRLKVEGRTVHVLEEP